MSVNRQLSRFTLSLFGDLHRGVGYPEHNRKCERRRSSWTVALYKCDLKTMSLEIVHRLQDIQRLSEGVAVKIASILQSIVLASGTLSYLLIAFAAQVFEL